MKNTLKHWVVNDYFTPNIKAEVILDTLLTPYVPDILRDQCGDQLGQLHFVTKEMSIQDEKRTDDRGEKIDYVLADDRRVYLVELKTTDGSLGKKQAHRYLDHCAGGRRFGAVLGDKLLDILAKKTGRSLEGAGEAAAQGLFDKILGEPGQRGQCGEQAKAFLKAHPSWRSTYKYLYTLGQLLDYLHPQGSADRTLWDKPLCLLYLTPTGMLPSQLFLEQEDFYLRPEDPDLGSVSLVKAKEFLRRERPEALAQLLADILDEIYGG